MYSSGATAPQSNRLTSGQMCFPGMERPAESWHPVAATLARVKRYFEGYQANDRQIFAKRKWIAGQLSMGVRTLARYLAFLRDTGWMTTIRREAHRAIRKVLHFSWPISGPSRRTGPFNYVFKQERPPRKKLKPAYDGDDEGLRAFYGLPPLEKAS